MRHLITSTKRPKMAYMESTFMYNTGSTLKFVYNIMSWSTNIDN